MLSGLTGVMASDFGSDEWGPIAVPVIRHVDTRATTVCIRDVTVARWTVVAYLGAIADDKQEAALIHALEVGVAEILARRRCARDGG